MKLFSNSKDRPDTATLQARITDLEQRAEAIPGDLESARSDLARALARGEDTAKARAAISGLEAEASQIPTAIDALENEIAQARIEEKVTALERMTAKRDKAAEAASKAWEGVEKALEKYRAEIAKIDFDGIDGWSISNLAEYLSAPRVISPVPGMIEDTDRHLQHLRIRTGQAPRRPVRQQPATGAESSTVKPSNNPGTRTHRVVIGDGPDRTAEDNGRSRRPERHGAAIQAELAAGV